MSPSVVLPTYNERATIVPLVREILATVPEAEVVVVDDDSPDRTWAAVEEAFAGDPRVRVLRRVGRRGLASALAEGLALAGGEALVWLDSDGSMPPATIPALLARLGEAEVAVASRYVPGAEDARTSRLRVWTSWLINAFAACLLGWRIRDYTSGFVAVRRAVLGRIPLRSDYSYGEYCIDFLCRAGRAGLRIVEVPYRFGERLAGETKTNPDPRRFLGLGLRYAITVLRLAVSGSLGAGAGAPAPGGSKGGSPPWARGDSERRDGR